MKTLLATLSVCLAWLSAEAALYPINLGTAPNDGQGDPLRVAMQKVNSNFVALAETSAQSSNGLVQWANGRFVIPNASEWGNIEADSLGRFRLRLASRPTIAADLLATNRLLYFAPDPEGIDSPLLSATQVSVQDLEWLAGLTNTPWVIAGAAAREAMPGYLAGGPVIVWPGFSSGEHFQLTTNEDGKALEFVTKGSEPNEWFTNLTILRGGGVAVQGSLSLNGTALQAGQGLTTVQTNSVNASTAAGTLNLIAGGNVTLRGTNHDSVLDVQISAAGATAEASDGLAYDSFESYADGTNVTFSGGSGWGGEGRLVGGGGVVTRSLSGGRTEKRLELRGGQFARKLGWANQWKRLFVVLLCRVNATNTFSSDWFAGGLCSGTTNLVHSTTTDNFVGFGTYFGCPWTVTTGTAVKYAGNGIHRPAYKRGTTWTLTSTTGGTGGTMSATEAVRSVWVLEIDRSSGSTYTAWVASPDAPRVENDIGFNTAMGVATSSYPWDGYYGFNRIAAGNEFASWTWDESTGGLDTFNVGWTNALVPLEISGVIIRRCW